MEVRKIRFKAKISGLMLIAALAVGMTGSGASQATVGDKDNSTVTVDVAEKVAIDISPEDLSYSGVNPGASLFETDGDINGGPVGAVEIENIGSQNITNVWMNTSTPNDNPFGTGLESQYDAGNFMEIKPTGESNSLDASNFRYVNRKEFNESRDLSYVFTPEAGDWRYGRFKAGDQEFFWAVNTTGGTCEIDGDNDDFRVGNVAHNQTATGATDFTSGGDFTSYALTSASGDAEALAAGVSFTPPGDSTRNYDVLVECGDPTYTVRSSYNINALGETDLSLDGSATDYVLNSTGDPQSHELQPGETFGVNTSIRVPQGVPSGNDGITGTLRVLVNTVGG